MQLSRSAQGLASVGPGAADADALRSLHAGGADFRNAAKPNTIVRATKLGDVGTPLLIAQLLTVDRRWT